MKLNIYAIYDSVADDVIMIATAKTDGLFLRTNAPYLAKLNPNYLQDCVVYQVGEFATTTMEVSPTVRRQIDWNSYNHPEDEGSIKTN